MGIFRYNVTMNDDLPSGIVNCYTRGAIVNGTQPAVNTVTVHQPHDFVIGHKFLYALTRTNIQLDRVFTVTAKTDTSITFSGLPFSFTDKNHLVPLGLDTGAALQPDGTYSKPNWDGTTISVFKDPHGDGAYTNAAVAIEPGGELGFWSGETDLWGISRQTGGKPQRIYILTSAAGVATDTIFVNEGDIIVGGGPGDAFALPVGNDGEVLTADSNVVGGIKWAPVAGGGADIIAVQVFS